MHSERFNFSAYTLSTLSPFITSSPTHFVKVPELSHHLVTEDCVNHEVSLDGPGDSFSIKNIFDRILCIDYLKDLWETNYLRGLHLKPPKFEHIFVALITFFPFLLCKYF